MPLLLSCLCFLCGAIRLVVSITLISPRPSLATALLLLIALVALVIAAVLIIQILLELALRILLGADRNVHHIATARLLLIGLLIIVEVRVGGLVFRVIGHAAGILWLIITITTDSSIPVIALFLISGWTEVTDAVTAEHTLLISLRAEFTFTSAALLRGLTLHIWLLLVVVKVILGVGLLLVRVG